MTFTRYNALRESRRQVKAYLQMLKDCNQLQTAKTFKEMSENKTAANVAQSNGGTDKSNFSFANQFNKVTFSVDVTDFNYCKLGELYTDKVPTIYKLDGIWINKSPLGESPVFIVGELGKLVNMPMHLTATARDILANADAVNAIRNGKVGFTVYEYESHARKCYNVKFCDL